LPDSSFLRRSLQIDGVAFRPVRSPAPGRRRLTPTRSGTEPACSWPNRASSRSCP